DGRTRWSPASSAAFPLHVTATADQTVTYGKPSFWVTIGGSAGGSEIPTSGWYVTGASLVLNATPNLGQTFVSWQGTGDGNYTGNQSGTTLVVLGEITEFASFQPAAKAATVITSFWSSPTTWAILGLVGLLVGLIVGIAVRRFRTAPASTKAAAPVAPWTADDSGTGSGGGGTAAGGTP
ncbi:MAG: hypothetical protein L3K01_02505, partial [Thermoplasmata archaeon]|nr:hypothetical protein [Thermoplasmata archaeon]